MARYTKKELCKVKPGTWLTLSWNDAPNSVAMLLIRMDPEERGQVALKVFHPERGQFWITHDQVFGVHEQIVIPAPSQNPSVESRTNDQPDHVDSSGVHTNAVAPNGFVSAVVSRTTSSCPMPLPKSKTCAANKELL